MKYIRFKNGIIKQDSEIFTAREKPLNVADSIKELCDEFVNTWENSKPSFWDKLENAISEKNSVKFDVHKELFGAIWTDKGLIYVAKMNEKGCLELL